MKLATNISFNSLTSIFSTEQMSWTISNHWSSLAGSALQTFWLQLFCCYKQNLCQVSVSSLCSLLSFPRTSFEPYITAESFRKKRVIGLRVRTFCQTVSELNDELSCAEYMLHLEKKSRWMQVKHKQTKRHIHNTNPAFRNTLQIQTRAYNHAMALWDRTVLS